MTFRDKVAKMFDFEIEAPVYVSLLLISLLIILCIVIYFVFTRALKQKKYLERPKGLLFLGEWWYEFTNNFVHKTMGYHAEGMTGYFMALFAYLIIAFNISLFGLPSIIDYLGVTLSLSIIMFVMIHATAIKYQKLRYFHRYIEPFIVWLPINLITMWTPIISTCMRMFGNALSGSILTGIVQWSLGNLSGKMFGSLRDAALLNYWPSWDINQNTLWTDIFLAPIPIGVLNIYFSLFSAYVQTTVFATLSALWMAQERPSDEEIEAKLPTREETSSNKKKAARIES